MKTVTVDMLRAHLMAASITAMVIGCVELLSMSFLPVSDRTFASTPVRLLVLVVIVCGVSLIRHFALAAFERAMQRHYVEPDPSTTWPMVVKTQFPWRGLVILHLRLTGRPFVLAKQ